MNKRAVARKRALRSPTQRDPGRASVVDLGPLAVACASLALGYAVTAKYARDEQVADHATMLADTYRSLSAHLSGLALSFGGARPRAKATCGERLRWEWLASSARLMDGAPDRRLLAECAQVQEAADLATAALQRDSAVELHPAMRQIRATLIRARNASLRLAAQSGQSRSPLLRREA